MSNVTIVTIEREGDFPLFEAVVHHNIMGGSCRVSQRGRSKLQVQVTCSPTFMAGALKDADAKFQLDPDRRHITLQSLPEIHV